MRAYPLSREWLALLIRRMDAVAAVYRLAALMSPGTRSRRSHVEFHRRGRFDATITLHDGRDFGVVRQGLALRRRSLYDRLRAIAEYDYTRRPDTVLILVPSVWEERLTGKFCERLNLRDSYIAAAAEAAWTGTAALMADAGGPNSRVDTIEFDHDHADMAEAELRRRGLLDRVRVLRGDSAEILPTLTEPYDVVFGDGGKREEVADELRRLIRPGGASAEVKRRLREPLIRTLGALRESLRRGDTPEADVLSKARNEYLSAVWAALE